MRSSFLLIPILFTACVEGDVALFGCPDDEVCSPDAPTGLGFFGAELAGDLSLQPVATARGGTQSVTLRKKLGDQFFDLATAYTASGGSVLDVEAQQGPVVTFRASGDAASGILFIRDLDGQLLDRKTYPIHPLGRIGAVATNLESTSLPIAYLAGDVRIGVGLFSAPDPDGHEVRLVDESMTIELPGATRPAWDLVEIADAVPGTLSLSVAAAGQAAVTVEATIVAGVDQLVDHPGDPFVLGGLNLVCFDATTADHHVSGLTWSIASTNGTAAAVFSANCFFVSPDTAGEVTLTVAAGGVTKEVTYPVAEAQGKPRRLALPRSTPEGVIAAASSSR